jgi:DNA repair exonuclease SbcCD nuclease subunit
LTSFIHASDLHLDSPLKGLEVYEGAPDIEEIRSATRQALVNLVDYALNEQVPLVVFAGDLYDGDWPDFSTGLFFAQQMLRLSKAGIRVAIVWGNHDAQNKMTKSLVMPAHVKILSAHKAETCVYEDINIAVHGQSYAAAETTRNLAIDYPEPKAGMLNIGLLHCLISGAGGHQAYAPCTLDDLAAKGYDYWALGHVHEYKVLRESPLIAYPGCSQGRHIKETGPKGCVLVEANNGVLSQEFIRLDSLQWMTVTADISAVGTMEQVAEIFAQALGRRLAEMDGRLCCARILLTGRTSIHGRLLVHPDELTANIRAVAADVSGQRVWVEKVCLETRSQMDLEALAQSDSPQGELLRYLQELSSLGDLDVDHAALKSKLAGSGVDFPKGRQAGLLQAAKDVLISMLTDTAASEKPS